MMSLSRRQFSILMSSFLFAACGKTEEPFRLEMDMFDEKYSELISNKSVAKIIAEGFQWSEGPTWDFDRECLYFTDVPQNKAYRWSEKSGFDVFLSPSGLDNVEGFREPGANGLFFDKNSRRLLVCNHGRRAIEWLDIETKKRELIIGKYQGSPFNSPNDIVASKAGDVFFTDPPYGLEGLNDSPLKKLRFNGVYHLSPNGNLQVIDDGLTFPNGILLSPDEKTLYVSQSDPTAPIIMRYRLGTENVVESKEVFYDFSKHMKTDAHGLPDGMSIDKDGVIFATGPGGIYSLSPQGVLLGKINLDRASSNCAFGGDGSTLFVTNQDRILKIETKTSGLKWN